MCCSVYHWLPANALVSRCDPPEWLLCSLLLRLPGGQQFQKVPIGEQPFLFQKQRFSQSVRAPVHSVHSILMTAGFDSKCHCGLSEDEQQWARQPIHVVHSQGTHFTGRPSMPSNYGMRGDRACFYVINYSLWTSTNCRADSAVILQCEYHAEGPSKQLVRIALTFRHAARRTSSEEAHLPNHVITCVRAALPACQTCNVSDLHAGAVRLRRPMQHQAPLIVAICCTSSPASSQYAYSIKLRRCRE